MEKPLVVCWHGFLGQASDWAQIPWSQEIQIESLDLWTEFVRLKPQSLKEWGQKQTLPAEKVWGVGYSMGGRILLHTLLAQPERFHGAILISTHPGLESEQARVERVTSDQRWQRKIRTLPWDELLDEWGRQSVLQTSPHWPRNESEFHREVLANVMSVTSLGRQQDLRPQLDSIVPPLTWWAGLRDTKFVSLHNELAQRGWDVDVTFESGHRLPWDQPAQFAQRVQKFVLKDASHLDK